MNFRKLCKIACIFFFLMCLQGNALAATIHGTVYEWYTFKPLENTIVEINSTPEQYFVAKDAEYSFNLTPGTYKIIANYFEGDTIVYTAKEEVIVSDEGEYVHDLLLFPTYQEDLLDQGFETVDLDFEEAELRSQANSQNTVLTFALLAFCILLLVGYIVKRDKGKPPEKVSYSHKESGDSNVSGSNSSKSNSLEPDLSELSKPLEPSEPDISEKKNIATDTKRPGYAESGETTLIEEDSGANYGSDIPLTAEYPPTEEQTGDISEAEVPVQEGIKLPESPKKDVNNVNPLPEEDPSPLSLENPEGPEVSLPDDLKEIMSLIRANGNRITQRELRKKSPYSESKVSLMLSDLEERGLIEKFKRGRGNIIRIPDGEALKQQDSRAGKSKEDTVL